MRHALLALLAAEPAHGYQLKLRLEQEFGSAWAGVNIGQVYTTLGRLERDGLVQSCFVAQESRPDKKVYEVTAAGRVDLNEWIASPPELPRLHQDVFMKLVLARSPGVNPVWSAAALIQRQRTAYLQLLRDLNNLAVSAGRTETELLLLQGAILHLQADLDWLDLLERRNTPGGKPPPL